MGTANGGNGKAKRSVTKRDYFVQQYDPETNTHVTVLPKANSETPYKDTSHAMAALRKSGLEGSFEVVAVTKRVKIRHEKIVKTTVEEV